MIFGIQGGRGSFNEQALLEYLGKKKIHRFEVRYLYTTERVLKYLRAGKIDRGLFAIQNAEGGMVRESIYALAKYNCNIKEEISFLVRHFLMKRKDNSLTSPKKIMAHDQVFAQCHKNLARIYPAAKLITGKGDLIDTARAAKALAEGKIDKSTFILGPRILGDIYDLEIVRGNLQDIKDNFTDFLLVSR